MNLISYYYNCSPEYINSIDLNLYNQLKRIIERLPKRKKQAEINADLFWLLTEKDWSYDSVFFGVGMKAPDILNIKSSLNEIKENNNRKLCITSTTLDTKWHADFAKYFGSKLVQIEAQFGKVEAMFKDFCGFRIAYAEKRLALGIEIVIDRPSSFFPDRKNIISGMASFDIAKNTLTTIGLDCPIWLIGIKEI
jgi:hypothetical protein